MTPHDFYRRLGASSEACCEAYRALFQNPPGEQALACIREATNKAWVLGNDRFRLEIEAFLQRHKIRGREQMFLKLESIRL